MALKNEDVWIFTPIEWAYLMAVLFFFNISINRVHPFMGFMYHFTLVRDVCTDAYSSMGKMLNISILLLHDRIPSTTPGAEPPRDDRDSGSARSHSTHLETSSSDRPKMVTYTEPQTVSSYMSVKFTRRTLRMPNFTRATHAQPSLSNFPRRDSDFGERTCSCGTTLGERNFPTSPQNKITKLTHCSRYVPMRTISTPQIK